MKRSSLYISLLALVALSSCRKDATLPDPGTPEFYVKASVAGSSQEVYAGDEGYYMYTDYRVEEGVVHLVGDLMSSEENRASWKIEFSSDQVDGAIDVEKVLEPGNKSLESTDLIGNKTIVNIIPYASFGAETRVIPNVYWRFNFGNVIPAVNPVFPYDTANYSGQQPLVTVGSEFDNQHDLETTRCIDVQHPDDWAAFEVDVLQVGVYRFYLAPYFQNSVNDVFWDVNGQFAAHGDTFLYRLPNGSTGDIFQVTAGFRHNSGAKTCQGREILVYESTQRPPKMDFNYKVESAATTDSMHLNTVKITYTTASGTVYTSALHDAPGMITITDVTQYINDEDGRPTRKVSLNGSFLLQDATGDELRIDNAEFVIAVATSDP